jgi:hypothetical protein
MTVCTGKNTHQILTLSQVRFLVVVKLFVSRPSKKCFPNTVRKNSGGKRLDFKAKVHEILHTAKIFVSE